MFLPYNTTSTIIKNIKLTPCFALLFCLPLSAHLLSQNIKISLSSNDENHEPIPMMWSGESFEGMIANLERRERLPQQNVTSATVEQSTLQEAVTAPEIVSISPRAARAVEVPVVSRIPLANVVGLTAATMDEQRALDSSFSNEEDKNFSAPLTQNQIVMDSPHNTSASSAISQEESQISLEKKSPTAAKGSFNGARISQAEPPAQKLGAQKPSSGSGIMKFMSDQQDMSHYITSFFIKDPKVSEYKAKSNQLFQGLKTKYPDQLRAYSYLEKISYEKQGEIVAVLTPGTLEPLKGTLLLTSALLR